MGNFLTHEQKNKLIALVIECRKTGSVKIPAEILVLLRWQHHNSSVGKVFFDYKKRGNKFFLTLRYACSGLAVKTKDLLNITF